MLDEKVSKMNSNQAHIKLFFSTAGQASNQDFAWRSEDKSPIPEILDELSKQYIDDQEVSWIVQRKSEDYLLLIARQLKSRITDPGLRPHTNAFAIEMSAEDEGWMRAIMLELLQNAETFAIQVDGLVRVDPDDVEYGWAVQFEELRILLDDLRFKYEIGYENNQADRRTYRYSSADDRIAITEKLKSTSLPNAKWLAICNPIVRDVVLAMPVWILITDTIPTPRTDSGSRDEPSSSPSSEEIALAVIATAALILLWLLIRKRK